MFSLISSSIQTKSASHDPFFAARPLKHHLSRNLCLLLSCLFLLPACNRALFPNPESEVTDTSANSSQLIADTLKQDQILAYVQQGDLYLVAPDYAQPVKLYTPQKKELPLNQDIQNFQFSPTHRYLIWYSANQGLIKLDLSNLTTSVLTPPSAWLNQNPHFSYTPEQDVVHYIDTDGTEYNSINLDSDQKITLPIPHPFGNLFTISPDNTHILFISGFGQTQQFPEFMITDTNLENPVRFSTTTSLNKRTSVAWTPDSSAFLIIDNDYQVFRIPASDPDTRQVIFETEPDTEFISLTKKDDLYFLETNARRWQVINAQGTQIASVPLEIASEINLPKFIPWHNKSFLIEETLRVESDQFNRLWISNFIGIKKKIIDRYHQVRLDDLTPEI